MRLIDADALMDALGLAVDCADCSRNGTFGCKEESSFVYACECITDAPAVDAVEVVRCKDCKWFVDYVYMGYVCMNDYISRSIDDCGCYPDFSPYPDFFCSYGERRTDE